MDARNENNFIDWKKIMQFRYVQSRWWKHFCACISEHLRFRKEGLESVPPRYFFSWAIKKPAINGVYRQIVYARI